ncbi:hypothetical protein EHQ27_01335 [Leptospira wolffii]|uniref:hypothetical protein n=1 Tax=Leptospira wolffii TaxID=409998 RepID=UPI0010837C7A|nr:hypothetical protein [Leptospira wolffii]TGK59266.1 hypothetical protein EHQ32_10775 [Leptospira wolffii]TGK71352.1 hypothetical protein EHQ35_14570 [Leptospira wolffii]TGK77919.1 hypothetical protein EHQ27_01335 [Leptospira wolffii]TGL29371.1 hypothetical protein EHQ57_10585 [Leptospira wolffii]
MRQIGQKEGGEKGKFLRLLPVGQVTMKYTGAHQIFRPNALEWAFGVNVDSILKLEKTGDLTYWGEAGGVLILE